MRLASCSIAKGQKHLLHRPIMFGMFYAALDMCCVRTSSAAVARQVDFLCGYRLDTIDRFQDSMIGILPMFSLAVRTRPWLLDPSVCTHSRLTSDISRCYRALLKLLLNATVGWPSSVHSISVHMD